MCDFVSYVIVGEIVCDCFFVGVIVYYYFYFCVNAIVYVCDIVGVIV